LLGINTDFSITVSSEEAEPVRIVPITLLQCSSCHGSFSVWSPMAQAGKIWSGKSEWILHQKYYGIFQLFYIMPKTIRGL